MAALAVADLDEGLHDLDVMRADCPLICLLSPPFPRDVLSATEPKPLLGWLPARPARLAELRLLCTVGIAGERRPGEPGKKPEGQCPPQLSLQPKVSLLVSHASLCKLCLTSLNPGMLVFRCRAVDSSGETQLACLTDKHVNTHARPPSYSTVRVCA